MKKPISTSAIIIQTGTEFANHLYSQYEHSKRKDTKCVFNELLRYRFEQFETVSCVEFLSASFMNEKNFFSPIDFSDNYMSDRLNWVKT